MYVSTSAIVRRLTALLLLAISAGGAAAQSDQTAPVLVPGLDNFSLRDVPAPSPIATPQPTPAPTERATPRATATPAPVEAPLPIKPQPATIATPRPSATPTSIPTPVALPPVVPIPAAPASPTPVAAPAPIEAPAVSSTLYWLIGAGVILLLAGSAWLFVRRRSPAPEPLDIDILAGQADVTPADLPPADLPPVDLSTPRVVSPSPVTPPAAAPRPWIELTLHPRRAGTNVLSAAVDYEIGIRNTGTATATGVRLDIRLLSAAADQDALLAALFAAAIDRPAITPFDLPAGDDLLTTGMAMLPRDLITVLTMRDRPHFVPLLAVNTRYGWAGAAQDGQTAAAYVIGIERPDGGKMAPFRLDTGPRMQDGVGQRPHDLAVRR